MAWFEVVAKLLSFAQSPEGIALGSQILALYQSLYHAFHGMTAVPEDAVDNHIRSWVAANKS